MGLALKIKLQDQRGKEQARTLRPAPEMRIVEPAMASYLVAGK
jgi:hypothetical protein